MDSISQFCLGAAIGQVVLGSKLGRKSAVIGGVVATIPDLDSLLFLHLDEVSQLVFHRGFSHSLIFCVFGAIVLSALMRKWKRNLCSFRRWVLFFFLAFFTHSILDCFTSWGTQLFWPLSYRVAFASVFIIDPLYTLPLFLGIWGTVFSQRIRFVVIGLGLSTFYLLLTLGIKQYVNMQFERGLEKVGINATAYVTRPTPFNCFLWGITVDVKGDYYFYGYYSVFDDSIPTDFVKSELKQHHVLMSYMPNKSLSQLLFFMKDYYVVSQRELIYIHDARYGRFGGWMPNYKGVYVFTYTFDPKTGEIQHHRPSVSKDVFSSIYYRALGTLVK